MRCIAKGMANGYGRSQMLRNGHFSRLLIEKSPASCVDGVSKEAISRHLASHNPGYHRTSVDPDPTFSRDPFVNAIKDPM